MKLQKSCPECGILIIFDKKEIKKLSKEQEHNIQERNKPFIKILEEQEYVGFFKKRKVNKYTGFSRQLIRTFITNAFGYIICPVCKTEQLLVKEEK